MQLKLIISIFLFFTTILVKGEGEKLDTLGTPIINEFTETICRGTTYEGYSFFGTYRDTFTIGTCDSIRIVHLRFHTPTFDTEEHICVEEGDPNPPEFGTFEETRIDSNGCEFMHTLIVAPQPADILTTATLCNGDTYTTTEGVLIDTTGIFILEELNENGCVYYNLLDVTFLEVTPGTVDDIAICPGEAIVWYGSSYSEPGTYVTSGAICQEKIILNLTFLPEADCLVSSTSQTNEATYSLYPNPANDFVVIEGLGSSQEEQQVKVIDQRGEIVYSQLLSHSNNKLDLSELSSGIYLLQVTDGFKNTQVMKFIKG